ncbi:MAG TPA: hypothetical protein VF142_15090 [Longimicrobium sp.]
MKKICSLAAALIALTAAPAAAQVVLRPAPLTFKADSLTRGAEVRVVNTGPATVVLTSWTLGTFASRGGNEIPGRTAAIPRGGLRVPARSQAVLIIDMDTLAWKNAEGTYQSNLAVTYAGGTAEAQIFVTRPKPAPTAAPATATTKAARPVVRELTVDTREGRPGRYDDAVLVPAWQGTEINDSTFVFTTEAGAPALARVGAPREWDGHAQGREYPVRLSSLRGGRTYKGVVYLGADPVASRVELTVRASHRLRYLLLTVVLGVAAGLMVRRWMDLHRPVTLLRERVLRAGSAFKRAADSLELGPAATGGLITKFTGQQEEIYGKLKGLTRFFIKNDEVQKDFQTATAEVDALEARIASASALARERKALRAAHEAVLPLLTSARRPNADAKVLPQTPRVIEAAAITLAKPVELESMDALRTEAAGLRTFLPRWAAVFQEARARQEWLDRLSHDASADENTRLAAAQEELDRVHWDLWDLADAAAFDARTPESHMQNAEDALRQVAAARRVALKRPPGETYRGGREDEMAMTTGPEAARPGYVWLSVPGDGPLPATPAEQLTLAERIRVARGTRDVGIAVVAFLGSLLTTMATHYYSADPFGSFADYSAVFGWAFGITAAASLLAGSLTAGLATLQRAGMPLPRP